MTFCGKSIFNFVASCVFLLANSTISAAKSIESTSSGCRGIAPFYIPKLGVNILPVTEDVARQIGTRKAVQVGQVVADSIAWDADIFNGDIILELDGKNPASPERVIEIIKDMQGEQTLKLWRDGKTLLKTVVFPGLEVSEAQESRKTTAELRKERIERLRKSARDINMQKAVLVLPAERDEGECNSKKALSDAEIQEHLNVGYRRGLSDQLATSDAQLGYSLVKCAIEERWEIPPWKDALQPMTVRIWFGNGGRIVNYKLEKSSGDAKADRSILSAASRVGAIPGLPPAFIDAYKSKGIPCQFTVRPH